MADQKVSDLPALNGADVDVADLLYIVDSSAGSAGSKKITIGQFQIIPYTGSTANTVLYLNGSKIPTSSSALTFDGTDFATTGKVTATKLVPTGNAAAGNGMYLPTTNTLAWSTNGSERFRIGSSGEFGLAGANYGTSGQVLASQGAGAAPVWANAATGDAVLANNNAFTGANTFYNGTGQTFGTGTSTQDGIVLAGRAGGSSSYRVTLTPTTLSANRTLTLPNATDTLAVLGTAQSFTATQTFKGLTDTVYTISDGAAFEIDPANGSIQVVTLGASRTPAATNFAAGQSVLLGIDDGTAYTITWSTINPTWVTPGGAASAPTLATSGYTWILFWKVSTTIYATLVGSP